MSESETRQALHSLYQAEGGPAAVFSTKVADYRASRPDYAPALFQTLVATCPAAHGATVADVGAGTGLLTQGLLQQGYRVVAVEPSAAMRSAADEILGHHPGYRSVAGTAESMPLTDASVDLITAAQAFHWFDVERARRECRRVLKPAGQVALIWNDRVLEDPLHLALNEVFARFGGAKLTALVAHESREGVRVFFGSALVRELSWPHVHTLTEEGLLSLVFSRSYVPARDTPEGAEIARLTREVFRRFTANDTVNVRYRTALIMGRPA